MENHTSIVNFLLSIRQVLVIVRFNIKNPMNISILERLRIYVVKFLKAETFDYNSYCNDIEELLGTKIELVEKPVSINSKKLERLKIYLQSLSIAIDEIIRLLESEDISRAYDLTDAIHGLPEAVLNDSWNSKRYWKIYFEPYRAKWDSCFLENERKVFWKKFGLL